MDADDFRRNRLAGASSPYLRQHAGNPVHWQPWDDSTLAHARATDTPILLSIGYSACHWCHVMAHECFEDAAIAAAMNAAFVNIKLDREERPDIDRAYQLAHQGLSGRGGGWPLTVFLDPQNLVPFYIGTYFPPTPRHGLPAFPDVLQRVRAYYDQHRDELRAQAAQLQAWLQAGDNAAGGKTIDPEAVRAATMQRIAARFDVRHGGNAGAPKFPRPTEIEWLLDVDSATSRAMAHRGLAGMAARGLQDHLGGGFFRYCVDADWTIPHFEKMLYDNAQLLPVYARAAATGALDDTAREVARGAANGIIDWLDRDMRAPSGAFYAALDADSEGEEGRSYLWTRDDLRAAVDPADAALAEAAFGLDAPPNFEGRAWHLLRDMPIATLAARFDLPADAPALRLAAIRATLLHVRARRVQPARDDKVLVAWNALAIAGLARNSRMLDDPRSAALACNALDALRDGAWIDGALCANVAAPGSRIPGFLDDHAFLLDALLEVMQLAFEPARLAWAIELANALLDRFADAASGGFRFSTAAHATPLTRVRSWLDDALPNGNAVAIRALLRLGHLVGEQRWLDAADAALRAGADALQRYPDACPTLLRALDESVRPRLQCVVCCTQAQAPEWRAGVATALRACGLLPGGDAVDAFFITDPEAALPGLLAERRDSSGAGTAWICAGFTCQAPVGNPAALARAVRDAMSA